MGNVNTDELRVAAEGMVLADAQRHILAYRLARKLAGRSSFIDDLTVKELLDLIDQSMWDMKAGVELMDVSDDAYRRNRVVAHGLRG